MTQGRFTPKGSVDRRHHGKPVAQPLPCGNSGKSLAVNHVWAKGIDSLLHSRAEQIPKEAFVVEARPLACDKDFAVYVERREGRLVGEGGRQNTDHMARLHQSGGEVLNMPLHPTGAVVGEASADEENMHAFDEWLR